MDKQSEQAMQNLVRGLPVASPLAPLAPFIAAAVAGIQREFSPVDDLREVLGLSADVPAADVISMAVGRVVRLKSVADVLGLDVDDLDFVDKASSIKGELILLAIDRNEAIRQLHVARSELADAKGSDNAKA
jgi:hypothetical protein